LDLTIKHKKQLPKEKLKQRRKNKLCFECKKEGYKALFYHQGQQEN
jgi:hypothetical protein